MPVYNNQSTISELTAIPFPYIGSDESGKGDYFGSMVIAGVWIDESIKDKFESIGIKDSKLLSDKRCKDIAYQIRDICRGRFQVVEISPERYNTLYDEFKREGKNLNHILAWGHSRVIENLVTSNPCLYAAADQFGNERYILSRLMTKGRGIKLFQFTKGERYIGVAAASILARDKFLTSIDRLSGEYGIKIPKGASNTVILPATQIFDKKGIEGLKKTVKLHHKTTQKVLNAVRK
ncbi:MAG: ribonuclease HIII [Nitrospirota bacterium]